jgi:NADH-quinone oxidoreductase subunit G
MAKISIDGKLYDAKPEKNLLETCLSLGINIPHFCFHPALGSVGACRLCAVKKFKDKDDTKGRIVMSCMEPVTEGMIVSVEDLEAKAFRASVIEGLMTNHPHDCPVCDEGGECHLQDMTIMAGHNYRRFDFPKRTYDNQELGPFISHEMNRCIQCYRCVRFYRDYAGGKDLNVFGSRNHVYFGRHENGPLENEFSGNLIEVCPTGVFTDKTLKKHFTRKWDLSNSPSVCVHCSVGCNTIISERYGSLRRVMSRYNGSVNGYFICDRGRFGYEFVNNDKRIRNAMIRSKKNTELRSVDNEELLLSLGSLFSKDKKIIGIGSPRASLESNFALLALVSEENFYHGISTREHRLTRLVSDFLQNSGIRTPSLKEIEKADAVLILGEDLANTAPMIALALRQSVRNLTNEEAQAKGIPLWNDSPVRESAQNNKSPLFVIASYIDSLEDIAEGSFHGSTAEITALGSAILSELDGKQNSSGTGIKNIKILAAQIALALKKAKNPLIISGISCGAEEVLLAALNISSALLSSGSNIMVSLVLPECNSMGLSLLPGRAFEEITESDGNQEVDTIVVLENNLYKRADKETVDELFKRSSHVVILEHLANETTEQADILLPSATFAESEGNFVNNEGRAQRFYKAIACDSQLKGSWNWLIDFINLRNGNQAVLWNRLDDITESVAKAFPIFSKLLKFLPDADFRMLNSKIPRQTLRYSGRTAMNANIAVSEQKPPEDLNSPLAFSMEGQQEKPPSARVPFYWTPGWNSVQAMYSYLDEPSGSMKGGDPGIRLFEPAEWIKNIYFGQSNEVSEIKKGEWHIVPVHQIFGSEELSSVSPSILQRTSEPFVLMNQYDADLISARNGDIVQLETGKLILKVKVKIEKSFKNGLAGLSVNLPGMPFIDIPGIAKFHKM